MNPLRTQHTNIELGAPKNWNEEQHGECNSLPCVRVMQPDGTHTYTSFWTPTPDELADLVVGGTVKLTLFSFTHPPVAVEVAKLVSSSTIVYRT